MRDKLGVLLVEDEAGGISVQLFADPKAAGESFKELRGRTGDKPSRATFVGIAWSSTCASHVESKMLPEPVLEASDGWVVGEGPRKETPA